MQARLPLLKITLEPPVFRNSGDGDPSTLLCVNNDGIVSANAVNLTLRVSAQKDMQKVILYEQTLDLGRIEANSNNVQKEIRLPAKIISGLQPGDVELEISGQYAEVRG